MVAGGRQLFDNSFLTHLETGRLIWSGHGIPHHDPYTFTAVGQRWVVQSWFASVIYGGVDRLWGLAGLRVQFALTGGVLAGLGWMLTSAAGDVIRRTAAVFPFIAIAAFGWSHRPYVIGLICLGLVLLASDDRLGAHWLVPVGWLWVNTHGGWPLGFVVLGALWLGSRLDGHDGKRERRVMMWLGVGALVGCLNPFGPQLLLFPLSVIGRQEAFGRIVEWQAPTFTGRDEQVFLLALGLAIIALRVRPTWRRVVPLVLFTAAALISARNVQVAALVLLPGTAEGLRRTSAETYAVLARPIAVAAGSLGVVTLLTASLGDAFGDEPYPVAASRFLEDRELDPTHARVVSLDYVGNYWEARYGIEGKVFVDDRIEVLPLDVLDDYATLVSGGPEWEAALRRYRPDAVVWERDQPLAQLLRASDEWEVVYQDEKFVIALPTR